MSLRHILLGFLETPASGYDLKRAFEESVRHFWRADLAQIYPTLHRLRRDGLVRVKEEPSPKGPARKIYSRTAAGSRALRGWLEEEPDLRPGRIDFLARLYFVGQAGEGCEIRRLLLDLEQSFSRRLEALQAIDVGLRQGEPGCPPDLTAADAGPYLTLLCGIRRTEATLDWCRESLEILERLDGETAGSLAEPRTGSNDARRKP